MKNVFLLLIFMLIGCSSYHLVDQSENDKNKFNQFADDRKGIIMLRNGEIYSGDKIRAVTDSLIWSVLISDGQYEFSKKLVYHSVPFSDVDKVLFVNRNQGAAQGIGYGMLVGTSAGFLAGLISGPNSEFSRLQTGGIMAVFVGIPAGVIFGLAVGAVEGKKEIYHFKE
jgi:hypothetical protein